jgi:hydroxymethylbilane synthase
MRPRAVRRAPERAGRQLPHPDVALAELGPGDTLTLTARAALPDGSEMHEDLRCGPRSEPERLDIEAGEAPRHRIGPGFPVEGW